VAGKRYVGRTYLFHEHDELHPVQTRLGEIEGEWSRHVSDVRSMGRYDTGLKKDQLISTGFYVC
jgi:hypothetical protein